jgi:hypothetical protein
MGLGDLVTNLKDKAVGGMNAVADYVSDSAPVKLASEAYQAAKDTVVAVKDSAVAVKDSVVATAVNIGTNIVPSLVDKISGLSLTTGLGKYIPDSIKVAAKTAVENIDTLAIASDSPRGAIGYQLSKNGTWKSEDGKLTVTRVDGKGLASGSQCKDSVWNAAADYEKSQGGACTVAGDAVTRTAGTETEATVGQKSEDGSLLFTNIYDATGQRIAKSVGDLDENKKELKLTQDEWAYLKGETDVAPPPRAGEEVQRTAVSGEGAAFKDYKYTDEQGKEVEVRAGNGEVTITRRGPDGKVHTEVKAMKDLTTAEIGQVKAKRDVIAGTSTVTTPGGEMQQGPEGRTLKINGETVNFVNGKAIWYGAEGKVISELTDKLVTLASTAQGNVSMVMPSAEIQEAARLAQQRLANGPDDVMDVLVSPDMVIALTKRLRIDRMRNGNTIFRARKPDGEESVFMLENSGKLLHFVDGKFVAADDNANLAWKSFTAQLENSHGAKLDKETGNLTLPALEAIGRRITIGTDPAAQINIDMDEEGPTVTTPTAVAGFDGNKVVINAPSLGGEVTWDGKAFTTPGFQVTPDKMIDREHGTEIQANGDITTDHGKGPTLKANGSVDFDGTTFVDADGNVRSGSWRASAGYDAAAATGGSLEKATQGKITSATADADAVYKKVLNRTVRMCDISSLDAAYSSISGLMATFANAGNGAMVAQLVHALGKINEVRGAAVAPAYAAQLAMDKGITSESQIANIQGRLLTDTPEHAVALTIAHAA